MFRPLQILAYLLLAAAPAFAGSNSADKNDLPTQICPHAVAGGTECFVTKEERKQARKAFDDGLKLERKQQFEQAFERFDQAVRLVPGDPGFLTAREMVKAQLVFDSVKKGDGMLALHQDQAAISAFRSVLNLDPDNAYARQRLADAVHIPLASYSPLLPTPLSDAGEIMLLPRSDLAALHYRGDTRGLYEQIAAAYGIKANFDDSVAARNVRFDVDQVDFDTAMRLAGQVTKTMTSPLDSGHFIVLPDNPENRKQYERMSLQIFQLPPHSTVQEGNDVVAVMRNMFDLRYVSAGAVAGTVEVRAAQWQLSGLTQLLDQIANRKPQVLLEISVYDLNHQLMRDLGVHVPNTFNLFNIPASALAGLGGQNIQDIINQLIAGGGINQAGAGLSGLLAQLGGAGQNSIFNQALATFGGGLTLEGLTLDKLAANLSVNESWARSLDTVTLRAGQGSDATFHLGTRYPIINASFAPIFNTPQISQTLANQTFIPPIPSVSYEDIGLNMKAKPSVNGNGDVRLDLELQVRALTGSSANGVPIISNREFKGSMSVRDGEPTVIAGAVTESETRTLTGVPGFGQFPVLRQITSDNAAQVDQDELLIVLTPHVLSNYDRSSNTIWLGGK